MVNMLVNMLAMCHYAVVFMKVGDLMYMCVLESFMELGISMLPRSDNYTDLPAVSLQPLMDGVHTKEALDLVWLPSCRYDGSEILPISQLYA